MKQRVTVDVERCMACHTCELACAVAHSRAGELTAALRSGERPSSRIYVRSAPRRSAGPMAVPVTCQHGADAACVAACPTGALGRLSSGAPVLVAEELCDGCGLCVGACPFGVIDLAEDGRPAYKCDLCVHLPGDQGPACVSSCPTRALSFREQRGDPGDYCPPTERRELFGYRIMTDACNGCGVCRKGCPVYAISGEPKQPHVIDVEMCTRCGLCFEKCRFEAIEKV